MLLMTSFFKEYIDDKEKGDWIKFIKDGGKAKMDGKVQKALKEAQEELERLTEDPEMEEIYYQRIKDLRDMLSYAYAAKEEGIELGLEQGIAQGIEQGIVQGRNEQKIDFILALHRKKIPVEEICDIVDLSKEQVEKIIKDSN